jgi:dynactin complex subunit
MSAPQIGNTVAITNPFKYRKYQGIVRYVGEVEDRAGIWIGVELQVNS